MNIDITRPVCYRFLARTKIKQFYNLQLTIAHDLCISLAILQQFFCKSVLPFHWRQRNSSQSTRLQQQLSITVTNNKNTQQQESKH